MPKIQTPSRIPMLPYFVATFEGRAVTIKRDSDYETTMEYVKQSIPKLRSANAQNISISTKLAEFGDMLVQISEETWPDLVDHVKTAEVTLDHTIEANRIPSGPPTRNTKGLGSDLPGENVLTTVRNPAIRGAPPYNKLWRAASNPIGTPHSSANRFSLTIRGTFLTIQLDNIHSSSSVQRLMKHIETTCGPPIAFQKLSLLGKPLNDESVLDQSGVTAGATLDLVLSTRKSMIYCIAPRHDTREKFTLSGVKVTLTVNRGWELVALAPSEDLEYKNVFQSVSWLVDVASDGTLWESIRHMERDCLYWDGLCALFSASFTLLHQQMKLSPSTMWTKCATTVEPKNSVVVPLHEVEPYISSVLSATGFEFSSSFLSHFMAQLESKPWTHLALRFLPQAESENLSYLEIDPSPQRVVRIMMLYKGLSDLDDLVWGASLLSLAEGSDTQGGTGAKPVESPDRDVFSAYEISWMEVF